MSKPSLWLETPRGYVAVDHVVAVEYGRNKRGGGFGVVVRLAATAGNDDDGFDLDARRLISCGTEDDAEQTVYDLVREIARRHASGEAGLIAVRRLGGEEGKIEIGYERPDAGD